MKFSRKSAIVAVGLVVLATTAAVVCLLGNTGAKLVIFDVGQGDSALVVDGGSQALIDGGPDRSVLAKLGRNISFFDRHIEIIFATHPHADHISGLIATLGRYRADKLVVSAACPDTTLGSRLLQEAAASDIEVVKASVGDSFFLGDSITATVLWPPREGLPPDIAAERDLNDCSLVLRLGSGKTAALLMGDVGKTVEHNLLRSVAPLDVDVLKVGHHGSGHSSSADFMSAASPTTAVISVGRNSYGHPSSALVRRLERAGIRVWRTDRDGDYWLSMRKAH